MAYMNDKTEDSGKKANKDYLPAGIEQIDLPITGMSCAACAAKVEKSISRLKGVSRVNVNLASSKASVAYEPLQTNEESIKDAVREAGYGVQEEPGEGKNLSMRGIRKNSTD